MKNLPFHVKIYSLLIIVIGLIIISLGFSITITSNFLSGVIFFILLSIIAESLAIPVGNSSYLSVNFAVALASIIIFHPLVASIIISMGFLFFVEYNNGKFDHILNTPLYKRVFNASANCISTMLSGFSYALGNTILPYFKFSRFSILGIILTIITYVIVNNFIFMILFSLLEKKSFKSLIAQNFWVFKNFLAIAPLGILMAIAYTSYGWFALLLFFGPLLLARYSFKLYLDMRNVYFETIRALTNALDAKDHYTNGHSHRVSHYSEVIARRMNLPSNKVDMIKTAALLHDIGKIGISDYILNKPGHLTDAEFSLIQQHSTIGYKILNDIDFLKEVSRIIKYHHEKYDGSGYPEGLKGEGIPIEAAILSVADAFDAMTSNRPYRNAMTYTAATNIIINEAGKQFNPIVAKVFKDIMAENREMLINVS